jgi:hypothetical protein
MLLEVASTFLAFKIEGALYEKPCATNQELTEITPQLGLRRRLPGVARSNKLKAHPTWLQLLLV